MPEPTKIPRAFAASGDKNSIPDSSGSPGFASWQEGFPAITSEPFAQGGIAPKRADFNGIFNALSLAILWQQQGGFYAYDATTDYDVGNVVLYSGDLYKCLSANGPSSAVKAPTDATVWAKVILTTATTSAAGYMSAADKTTVDSVILTNATQSAAGYMSAADKTKLDGLISTNATQNAAGYMSATDKALVDSIPGLGTFSKMFFSQTSGSYTAPRTGVYRITLKGGGGGGAGSKDSPRGGSGGGEGGTLIMYRTLIQATSYAYVIGAGGTGGAYNIAGSEGGTGGATSITIEGTTYSAFGGGGASTPDTTSSPGGGGTASSVSDAIAITGAPGCPGAFFTSGLFAMSGSGGGAGGGIATVVSVLTAPGVMGGGGAGGAVYNGTVSGGANGGDGYIIIEYQG